MATCEPSVSVPTIRLIGSCAVAWSICCWVNDAKSSVPSAAATINVGAITGLGPVRSGATPGCEMTWLSAPSIWARPSGVSASPRKSSVVEIVSREPPNSSSILPLAADTRLSSGRNAVLSACGAIRVKPAPRPKVTARSTISVTIGLAVIRRLTASSNLVMLGIPLVLEVQNHCVLTANFVPHLARREAPDNATLPARWRRSNRCEANWRGLKVGEPAFPRRA